MSQKVRIFSSNNNKGVERIDENYKKEYNEEGYDQYGYDRNGWDSRWFNIYGIHRITQNYFDEKGLDEWSFDVNGINHRWDTIGDVVGEKENIFWHPWDMVCEFNSIGIHKITHTPFNECWLNWKGIDKQGNAVITKKYHNLCIQSESLHKEIEQLNEKKQQLIDLKNTQVSKKREAVIKESKGRKKKFELRIKELQQHRKNLEEEFKTISSPFALKKPEWKVKRDMFNNLELEIQHINYKISQEEIFMEEIFLNESKNHDVWDLDIRIWNIEKRIDYKEDKLIQLQKDIDEEKSKQSVLEDFFNT